MKNIYMTFCYCNSYLYILYLFYGYEIAPYYVSYTQRVINKIIEAWIAMRFDEK